MAGTYHEQISIAVDTVLADADPVPFGGVTGGIVHVPAGSSLTLLTFHALDPQDGTTYHPLHDAAGAVTLTVAAGRSVELPSACYGAKALKMTGNVDGTVAISAHG